MTSTTLPHPRTLTASDPSTRWRGATAFAVLASAVLSQLFVARLALRPVMAGALAVTVLGMAVLVVSVYLATPSLALFLVGGVIVGAGGGALFKSVVTTIVSVSPPERRAEAFAGMFLTAYVGPTVPVVALGVMTQSLSPKPSCSSSSRRSPSQWSWPRPGCWRGASG